MYFVYILYSKKFNRFYKGQTENIEARLKKHNDGQVPSTKPFIPFELVIFFEKETREEALLLEKKLKNLNTEDLIKFIKKYKAN
jgi:putative endonuclease